MKPSSTTSALLPDPFYCLQLGRVLVVVVHTGVRSSHFPALTSIYWGLHIPSSSSSFLTLEHIDDDMCNSMHWPSVGELWSVSRRGRSEGPDDSDKTTELMVLGVCEAVGEDCMQREREYKESLKSSIWPQSLDIVSLR